jgi:Domain of unknown function (DUF4350)
VTSRRRAPILAAAAFVAFVVLLVVVGVPPRPEDAGPAGTAALTELLRRRGIEVSSADRPEGDVTFFLRADLRGPDEAERLLDWVRAGGRLVVADPESRVPGLVGMSSEQEVGGLTTARTLEVDCVAPAVVGVDAIVAGTGDQTWTPGPASVECFRGDRGSFLVIRRLDEGEVVLLGGLTPFTNEYLRDEDDGVLAWNVLGAPGEPVVLGSALPEGAGRPPGLWGLLPPVARAVLLQLAAAAVIFAIVRGRRLGSPVGERLPSPIPATELAVATGRLYRRSRAASHASAILQRRFRARVGRRLGLGSAPTEEQVASSVGATGLAPEQEVAGALRPDGSEEELVATGRALERLSRRIEGEAP